MQCIKCGREIPDGELFCSACASGPAVAVATAPKPATPPKPAPPRYAPRPRGRGGLIAAVMILALLFAGAVSYIGYDLLTVSEKRTSLAVREADLTLRENEQTKREQELADAQAALADAQAEIETLKTEIETLNSTITGSESDYYQSQYDQQVEMTQLVSENEALYEMVKTLEEKNTALDERLNTATARAAVYQEKADFLDAYAVFVENDNTSYYHNYSCSSFKKKSFWVYSRKLAESYGYTACPICGG